MKRVCVIFLSVLSAISSSASWYWPFGADSEENEKELPRISTLMRPATDLIDEAADLAGDGKRDEAIEKYRLALAELSRIEQENAERAKSMEFATLRNKRAYVNAAIDALLLAQVKANEKSVAVSDTTELEAKLAAEKVAKAQAQASPQAQVKSKPKAKSKPKVWAKAIPKAQAVAQAKPKTPREEVVAAVDRGDFAVAEAMVKKMLAEKPNGAMALNLKAMVEAKQGKYKEAESTLDQAIASNQRNAAAYFNMARLMLEVHPDDKSVARRYYETGRAMGGKRDAELEERLK